MKLTLMDMIASLVISCLMMVSFEFVIVQAQNSCSPESAGSCVVDGFIGSKVIYEDAFFKVWNFTLSPGEMTSMHRHDCDYHFVAIQPTELEVYGEKGHRLFSFRAEGTLGFKIEGQELVQIPPTSASSGNSDFAPIRVPRVHAARNIGEGEYYEILFESKTNCV